MTLSFLKIIFKYFLVLSTIILFQFCTVVKVEERNGKDLILNSSNYNLIKGKYKNISFDTSFTLSSLIKYPKELKLNTKNLSIKVKPINSRRISISFFNYDTTVKEVILKGRYRKGYFFERTKLTTDFPFGPLMWGPGISRKAIGLTKQNNLIFFEEHGGIVFLVVLPVFGGEDERHFEFERIE